MDKRSLMTDRRQFLSGGTAIAAVAALPAQTAVGPVSAWDAAMTRYRAAVAAGLAHDASTIKPATRLYEGWFARNGLPKYEGDDHMAMGKYWDECHRRSAENPHIAAFNAAHDHGQDLADEECDSQRALMDMPAPHRAALRYKLDYILGGDADEYTECWSPDFVRQTIAACWETHDGQA